MVAFAVGGLLGDTIFHLLPEIFLGEDSPEHVRLVLVEPNRNLLLGVAIIIGFVTFVALDKGLRIATGGAGHNHDHGPATTDKNAMGIATGTDTGKADGESRLRKTVVQKDDKAMATKDSRKQEDINPSVKLGGYLNLMQASSSPFFLLMREEAGQRVSKTEITDVLQSGLYP